MKSLIGWKQKHKQTVVHKGGIDHLQPGRFSGWVVAEEVNLIEVRLLIGDHLIARGDINQQREDVNQKFNYHKASGFTVELPLSLPMVDWQESPRVLALSADGSSQVELGLLGRKGQAKELLKKLLQSDLLGLIGHCDGLVQGAVRGWACRANQSKAAEIWLQTHEQAPIQVICNLQREGMQKLRLPGQCGFAIETQSLPVGWQGCEVWCSFDHDGEYLLPQIGTITLPGKTREVIATEIAMEGVTAHPRTEATSAYKEMIREAPEELAEHWRRLEEFRYLLDRIEQQIWQDERARSVAPPQRESTSRNRIGRWLRLPSRTEDQNLYGE